MRVGAFSDLAEKDADQIFQVEGTVIHVRADEASARQLLFDRPDESSYVIARIELMDSGGAVKNLTRAGKVEKASKNDRVRRARIKGRKTAKALPVGRA